MMLGAAAVGVAVGLLSGLLGIGGGTIMVPVFRLVFGLSPIEATATSLFTIIPTSVAGMVSHLRNRTSVLKLGLAAGAAGAAMSPIGVMLANVSPDWAIMAAAAAVILYSAATMLRKALAAPSSETVAEEGESGAPGAQMTARKLWAGAAIGLAAGFMGGYVGVGGGFIMVPMFVSLLGVSMRLASGTSLVAVMLIAIPGAIEQAILGNVVFSAGIALAAGSIPGALLGAALVKYVPERLLRFVFAGFLAAVAVVLVVNEIGFPG